MTKIYKIGNIDCANCAAKIERLINQMPEVESATITFATKQLRVNAENPDGLLDKMTQLANKVENGVIITADRRRGSGKIQKNIKNLEQSKAAHEHNHGETCGCGHDHDHDHGCGHGDEHEHKHNHEETCGCGHDHDHDHDYGHEHTHNHDHEHEAAKERTSFFNKISDLHVIVIGAILFAAGLILENMGIEGLWRAGVFVLAYLILGGQILLTALRNIAKGQVFDENFLMSIATIGAFAIQEYPEAVGVMLFFRVGEFFEEKAVERSRNQIMEAVDLRPEVVNLVKGRDAKGTGKKDFEVKVIPAEDAQIGDVLLVRPGDRIPLDGVVLSGESRLDTSPITGEPVPVKVTSGSEVVSGCINTSGLLKIKVQRDLESSMVTRILDSVENAAASKPKIDKFITRFARVYTPVVVVLAALTAIVPSLMTGEWEYWIYTALTFLVISCPCALVLSVPLAFFSGIGAGSRQGILFKGGVSLEALKSVKAVVMDKTGTLTKGNFVVQNIIYSGNLIRYMALGGGTSDGLRNTSDGLQRGQNADMGKGVSKDDAEKFLLALAAGCELNSTHPIGESIVAAAEKHSLELEKPQAVEEIAGKGIKAVLSIGTVLCGNRKLMEDMGIKLQDYENSHGGSEVLLALNNEFIGSINISDTIKPEAERAVAAIKKQGIVTAMLTGDSEAGALEVAGKIGIDKVFARLLPEDKLTILRQLREEHGRVMFVGDGINDAPVLAGADVGAAMGSGADAAIEAADVVFMTSDVDAISKSINIAKTTGRIAVQNVVFALAVKAAVMVLGLAGMASMWMAVFADTGVAMLCVLNSIRILYKK